MKRTLTSLALALPLSLAVSPLPALAQAAPGASPVAEPTAAAKKEARERFEKGVVFYRDKEYQAALLEFKRAYELAPNFRVLYNLGQTSRELKDHASALASFQRYLAEGEKLEPGRRKDVEKWIEELKTKVARVTVTTTPAGAEITVDDLVVGKTPLASPLLLNAGRRKIAAALRGHVPVQRFVDVVGADSSEVSLELAPLVGPATGGPADSPAPPPPAPPPPKKEAPTGPRWAWVGLAGTGALGVATIILGVRALNAQSDFEELLTERTTAAELEDARGVTETFAIATDVVAGVTIAAAAVTVVLFVVEMSSSGPEPTAARVRIGPGALFVEGQF
ncbi:MAG: PEGA domain-containing protein [Polyangiaceae bacterium]|nr:PEGA domain-containing protein [Polyangiaceae bacterium]